MSCCLPQFCYPSNSCCNSLHIVPAFLSLAIHVTAIVFALLHRNPYFIIPAGVGVLCTIHSTYLTCKLDDLGTLQTNNQTFSQQNVALRGQIAQLSATTAEQTENLTRMEEHSRELESLRNRQADLLSEQTTQIMRLEAVVEQSARERIALEKHIQLLIQTSEQQIDSVQTLASSLVKGEGLMNNNLVSLKESLSSVNNIQQVQTALAERFKLMLERLPDTQFLEERERAIAKLRQEEEALREKMIELRVIAEQSSLEIARQERANDRFEGHLGRLDEQTTRLEACRQKIL